MFFNCLIAFYGPAACMIGVIFARCDSTLSVVLFVIALGCNGCCYPGFNSNYVDMAPDFAGILMGICNSIGNIPGFVAPIAAANFYSEGVIRNPIASRLISVKCFIAANFGELVARILHLCRGLRLHTNRSQPLLYLGITAMGFE